jgi:hypothetical protein
MKKNNTEPTKQPPEQKMLPLALIRLDGGTQQRGKLDDDTIADYADAIKRGDRFPPVTVFFDGECYWLAGGFHRVAAAGCADCKEISALIYQGTQRDAVLFACGENHDHGLRRTNEDKRRAVLTLLQDPDWNKWSNGAIARQCHVSTRYVGNLRDGLTMNVHSEATAGTASTATTGSRTYRTKHGTLAEMDTSKIGKEKSSEPTAAANADATVNAPVAPPSPEPEAGATTTALQEREASEESEDESADGSEGARTNDGGERGNVFPEDGGEANGNRAADDACTDNGGVGGGSEPPAAAINDEMLPDYLWNHLTGWTNNADRQIADMKDILKFPKERRDAKRTREVIAEVFGLSDNLAKWFRPSSSQGAKPAKPLALEQLRQMSADQRQAFFTASANEFGDEMRAVLPKKQKKSSEPERHPNEPELFGSETADVDAEHNAPAETANSGGAGASEPAPPAPERLLSHSEFLDAIGLTPLEFLELNDVLDGSETDDKGNQWWPASYLPVAKQVVAVWHSGKDPVAPAA